MVKLNFHDGKREHAENLSNSHQSVTYKTIEVKRVNRVIGVEVTGLHMTLPLSEAQIEDVNGALENHNVLFFRDQPTLTAEQQMAFAPTLGYYIFIQMLLSTKIIQNYLLYIPMENRSSIMVQIGTQMSQAIKNRQWVLYFKYIARRTPVETQILPICMPRTMLFRTK